MVFARAIRSFILNVVKGTQWSVPVNLCAWKIFSLLVEFQAQHRYFEILKIKKKTEKV